LDKVAQGHVDGYVKAFGLKKRQALQPQPQLEVITKNGWLKENGSWYYYKNGKKETGWLEYKKDVWYFLATDGKMLTGWLQWKNEWYYLNDAPDKGEMLTGWQYLDWKGKKDWYYFHQSGKMARNEKVSANLGPSGVLKS
jgi:glucan-binding YG repeat protein